MNAPHARSPDAVTIDPENPWLGLFSYAEETRAYFHGRDEETGELARRVQRKLLTVLFGQSGLGKTSLLRAGLVPRLRGEGYCPVYVRIDYAAESPVPSEQIKQAIFRATSEAGYWTRPGSAIEGESLWEFLHHRGDLLRNADGGVLMPLLIFDQFEEIFTLGQADDAGRLRAKQFLEDLADLVENRPPAVLEQRLEQDDEAAEQFDFARADYRILIALREDYLAHLEGVKTIMPSITQNRMRLARMNGAQALSAVVNPGGRLVSHEVAESIVRFVAGGSELGNAEIEPSLLSLVCRELNTVRQTQGRGEISADLLAGSRDTILSEFYERALADQPDGVRRVIEDELLTESGYRESLAEERVIKALAAAGATPDTLATLVNRRLLRIEERLDMRRVELTHDVLCSVVVASRNLRQEREARDATQRQLAMQQEREAATHRALLRARMVAGVCAVLMLVAVAGAAFGWIAMHRARAAEAEAQKSRSDAEKLVSFLIEDFYNELAPTGRLETLGKLAHMTVGYYDSLPAELATPQTHINRAMALVREGAALQASGNVDAAYRSFGAAQSVFEKLRASGDRSEAVTYGLALTLLSEGSSIVGTSGGGRGTAAELRQAADLLRPLAYTSGPSRRVRQAYADTLNYLTFTQPQETAVATSNEARKVLEGLGALDLSDLNAASSYADAADSEARHLLSLGRIAEAKKLEQQVYELAEKILARRPGDLHSLSDRSWAAELLGTLAQRQHDDAAAADYANKAARAGEDEVRFNPSDLGSWSRWALGLGEVADLQFERGQVAQAIATMHSLLALERDPRRPSSLGPVLWFRWIQLANWQAQTGDTAAAAQSLKAFARDTGELAAQLAPQDPKRQLLVRPEQGIGGAVQLTEGASQAALTDATAVIARVESVGIPAGDVGASNLRGNMLNGDLQTAATASIRLGRYRQAEALARQWLAVPPNKTSEADPQIKESRARSVLADAVAMQGRGDEAQKALQPALAYYQQQQQAGARGMTFRHDYAYALYVSAISSAADAEGRERRKTALDEAATLIAGASTEAQQLAEMREVTTLITAGRASH
ncbi:ATP-binding protein [Rhodanobacter sp. B05]|uniref:nSTAND1 domain-containing NTPase n=1 Tax=Rhodanobacter sp. B05 TaxID=1945859 RepID=UPI0011158B5F|nr:ATP-binding protein [Rhodanobacter sp. B05]